MISILTIIILSMMLGALFVFFTSKKKREKAFPDKKAGSFHEHPDSGVGVGSSLNATKILDSHDTLLARRVEIRLLPDEIEALWRSKKSIPEMPIVRGTIMRRVYISYWAYVMPLDEPLDLDKNGMTPGARKLKKAQYVLIYLNAPTLYYSNRDPLYFELVAKASLRINSEPFVSVIYVKDPSDVPAEMSEMDSFLRNSPCICEGGHIKLIG